MNSVDLNVDKNQPRFSLDKKHLFYALNIITYAYFGYLIYDYFQLFAENPNNDIATAHFGRAIYSAFGLMVIYVLLTGKLYFWVLGLCLSLSYIFESYFIYRYIHSKTQIYINIGLKVYSESPDNQILFLHYLIFFSWVLLGLSLFTKRFRNITRIITFTATTIILGITFIVHYTLIENGLFKVQDDICHEMTEVAHKFDDEAYYQYCDIYGIDCSIHIGGGMPEMPNGYVENMVGRDYQMRVDGISDRPGDWATILLKLEDTLAKDGVTLGYADNSPEARISVARMIEIAPVFEIPRTFEDGIRYRAMVMLHMRRLDDGQIEHRLMVDNVRNRRYWLQYEWMFKFIIMSACLIYAFGSVTLITYHRHVIRKRQQPEAG